MTTILEKPGFVRDKKLKIVGTSPVKHDGIDKVTGRAKFGADLFLPGMLVGKILRSSHPHARIKSIDTSAAEKLPGVKAVVTRADFPGSGSLISSGVALTPATLARARVTSSSTVRSCAAKPLTVSTRFGIRSARRW